ncbi:MAG: ATP-grasp domain-containing protein [Candidatus Omnitrophica bacterium]|nr:ATP-grasp domain-containing protein [Candidatus Omnitrophota bacterium]
MEMKGTQHTTQSIPAVVLGMTANGLSVTRSLGRQGVPVTGVDSGRHEPGMYSWYCDPRVCPDPGNDPEEFLHWLLDLGRSFARRPVLYLTSDKYIGVVSRARESLEKYFSFLLPDKEIVDAFLDKERTAELAARHGARHPRTFKVHEERDLREVLSMVAYPVILKPRFSHVWSRCYGGQKVIIANTGQELKDKYLYLRTQSQEVLVQEIIPGPDQNVHLFMAYYNEYSVSLALFCCRKLRQYPPHFGVGALMESIEEPSIQSVGERFLRSIGYRGLVGVEYKVDERTGEPVLIEVNMRTSLGGEISVQSGVDLPMIMYRHLACGESEPDKKHFSFVPGVKLMNLDLDTGSFLRYRREGGMTLGAWFLSFRAPKLAHTYFAADDLRPFFAVYSRFLRKIGRKVFARAGTASAPARRVPAVVLGMTANGLSVARSLGRRGILVIGLDSVADSIGFRSRYCRAACCPDVLREEAGFVEFLEHVGKHYREKPVLIMTADSYVDCVSRHEARLKRSFRFTIPRREQVSAFLDKRRTYEVFREYGLACPRSFLIASADGAVRAAAKVTFPCALKPARSHVWRQKYGGKKLFVVRSPRELRELAIKLIAQGQEIFVQELIPGADNFIYTFVAYYDRQGRALGIFTKQKIRQYPIKFGIGCFHESGQNPEVREKGLRFLSALGYTGFAGIEFKYDSREKRYKAVEVNIRTLMSGELAVRSGVDFPYLYYRDHTQQAVTPVTAFREGVKFVHEDLDPASFFRYRARGELTLRQWLATYRGEVHCTYFRVDDPLPFLFMSCRIVRTAWCKLRKYARFGLLRLRAGPVAWKRDSVPRLDRVAQFDEPEVTEGKKAGI